AAGEALADDPQDLPIEAVETLVVDLQQVESGFSDSAGDDAAMPYLGVIADAFQQSVGHARSSPAALSDGHRTSVFDRDLEQPGRAPHDASEVLSVVMLEPMLNPEAIAQRCGQQASP